MQRLFFFCVLEYIGDDYIALQLKNNPPENLKEFFDKIIEYIELLWKKAKLVHGDLSAFNILNYDGNPVFISKFEVLGMNGKNYEDTHRAAFQLQKGLYIPTPAIFMPHFKNVVETYKNNPDLWWGTRSVFKIK